MSCIKHTAIRKSKAHIKHIVRCKHDCFPDEKMLSHFDIEDSEEFKTTKYFCKTHFDMARIKEEESNYVELPKIYSFDSEREKEIMLNRNFKRVNQEVADMVKELLGTE